MAKKFPPEMIAAAKMAKKAFFSEATRTNENECENCGGNGKLYLFLADEGPYQTPASPYRGDGKVSKWWDGKWWVGNHAGFNCPQCKGTGGARMKQVHSFPTPEIIREVSERKDIDG